MNTKPDVFWERFFKNVDLAKARSYWDGDVSESSNYCRLRDLGFRDAEAVFFCLSPELKKRCSKLYQEGAN